MTVSLLAAALAIGCALAFSVADLLRKMLAERMRPLPLLVAMSAGMAPFFLGWWVWQGGGGGPGAAYWLPGLGSVVLNLAANLAFLEAVRIAPLSLTIPVLSLTPVFTTLLAVPLLGEVPSGRQLAGVVLVVAGVLWLNSGAGEGAALGRLWRSLGRERGSQLMAATALLWSLAMPLDKMALAASGAPFHGLALNSGVALGALLVLAGRGRLADLGRLRGRWGVLILLIVVGAAALVLILLAISETWIGFIETMKRGLGSFMAVVWGRLFFAEAVTARKLVAVGVIAAGVALIVW
jgi:drug/metabolite transporter (DMT)-like permease